MARYVFVIDVSDEFNLADNEAHADGLEQAIQTFDSVNDATFVGRPSDFGDDRLGPDHS